MWHVYELRAGEWFYFGCSKNPDGRHANHIKEMLTRLRHPEAPNRGPHGRAKSKCWLPALQQYPKACDWRLRVLSSHSCRADAEAEEERLIVAARDNPGRLNRSERADGGGRMPEAIRRRLEMLAIVEAIWSGVEAHVGGGYKIDIDTGRDIRAQIDPLRSKERAAAVSECCRRLGVCRATVYRVLHDDRYLPDIAP